MKDITDKEFELIRDYIKQHFGINLGKEKKTLVYSRLRNTLVELNCDDFTQYYNYLINDRTGQAVIRFIDKITTNHTFFMREVDHFDYFRQNVLPYIEQAYSNNKDIRLWCAGCSSGEEAYTLQMLLQDFFASKPGWNLEILATDISTQVLDKAVRGVYSKESVHTLPENWRKKYFKAYDNDHYIILDEVKKNITYRKFNLMSDQFPFKKPLQVIFCRNVMIYFDNETRVKLVEKYYNATAEGGYLFIGHSESLNHTNTKYKYIMPAIYRKEAR